MTARERVLRVSVKETTSSATQLVERDGQAGMSDLGGVAEPVGLGNSARGVSWSFVCIFDWRHDEPEHVQDLGLMY